MFMDLPRKPPLSETGETVGECTLKANTDANGRLTEDMVDLSLSPTGPPVAG